MSDPLDSAFLEGMPGSRVVARDTSPDGRIAIAAVSGSGGRETWRLCISDEPAADGSWTDAEVREDGH